MPKIEPRDFLMIPGPTPVPDAVLEAVARHPIGHRTPEFSALLKESVEGLKWLAETESDCLILTSSGTGAMEAAISNTISAGDKVLSLVCGNFSERWAQIAEAFGAQVERLKVEPGKAITAELVRKHLAAGNTKFHAVTITHNETSTGVINNVEEIGKVVREHGALSIVDAVTSFGATELPIDKWNLDVVVSGSQKALMLPPGLGVIFFGPRAWEAKAKCKTASFYFDLAKYRKSVQADTTPFTPNVSLFAGLKTSVQMMRDEGKEAIFLRHKRMRECLRAGLRALGLELFVSDDAASPSITAILPPAGITVDAIRKALKQKYRIFVADGQEDLKGKIFRIGHMGYVFERDILMTLGSLESVLIELGHKCNKGAAIGEAAAVLSGRK
ncbi:MAG TPA: alanine--glyoxylate aminotransferase family protein [Chroococcales cyanobacterium]